MSVDMRRVKRFPLKGVCSVTGKKFIIILKKVSEYTWAIDRVIKTNARIDDDKSFTKLVRLHGTFDLTSFKCPYCGTTGRMFRYYPMPVRGFKCNHCGYLNCIGSAVEDDFGVYVTCGNCGDGGYLGDFIREVGAGD